MDQESLKNQFLKTYDAYSDAIFRFIFMKVSGREIAQDLTQEVFMRFWQTTRKGEDLKNERAYLYTLARNLIIDWYRKKKESSLDVLTEAGVEFAGDGSQSITDNAEVSEILKVLEQLDTDSRELLLLRFVEGYSPKEISKIHNGTESPNAVSVRIHRALKKVQELMHYEKQ